MLGDSFLQVFLIVQIITMAVLAVLAVRYAYAHFKSSQLAHPETQPRAPEDYLSPATKQHLLQTSQIKFQEIINHSADQLQGDLKITSGHINNLVMRLATEIVSNELEHYRSELARLEKQAQQDMGGIRAEIAKHQAELKAKLAQEIEAEKQHLIKQIDTKLADAVGSFLTENLQHNVDLGAQSPYLIALLEEHKADFIKEVADESR